MKKILIIIISAVFLGMIFALVAINYKKESVKVVKNFKLNPLICSLNLQSCETNFNDEKVTFDISPKPVRFMEKTTIKISNLKTDYHNLTLKIYGVNMNMGTITTKLHKKENHYEAVVALSSCLLITMRYRAEIFNNDSSIGLSIDFDLKR